MREQDPPLTGVCYVRVHVEESGRLRYRVTVNPDISSAASERRWECRDQAGAVRAVQEFLAAFEAAAVTDR